MRLIPTPTPSLRDRSERSTAGFTVVEVLIGLVLLAIIAAALAGAAHGWSHAVSVSKVRAKQASIAVEVLEILKQDHSWMPPCDPRDVDTCTVTLSYFDLVTKLFDGPGTFTDPVTGLEFTAQAALTGVDSPADGLAAADADGMLPDYYRARISVSEADQQDAVVSTFEMTGTIGNTAKAGAPIVVHACTIWPQVDDRLAVQGCPTSTLQLPSPAGADPARPDAVAWAGAPAELRTVTIAPDAGAPVTVYGHVEGDPWSWVERWSGVTDATGTVRVTGLPPGNYVVRVAPRPGWQTWMARSVPGGEDDRWPSRSRPDEPRGTLIRLRSGRAQHVHQWMRPADVDFPVPVNWPARLGVVDNVVFPPMLCDDAPSPEAWYPQPPGSCAWPMSLRRIHLVPAPFGRDRMAGEQLNEFRIAGGSTDGTIPPGLYAAYMVIEIDFARFCMPWGLACSFFNDRPRTMAVPLDTPGGYVWIPPATGVCADEGPPKDRDGCTQWVTVGPITPPPLEIGAFPPLCLPSGSTPTYWPAPPDEDDPALTCDGGRVPNFSGTSPWWQTTDSFPTLAGQGTTGM